MLKVNKSISADFLAGGGEMGALTRSHDWSASPLGPPETWPQSLRTAVRLLLNTNHPMFIWWGPQLIQFYNDAYRQTMGPERHPSALGQRGRECWAEIWDIIGPQIEQVMRGGEARPGTRTSSFRSPVTAGSSKSTGPTATARSTRTVGIGGVLVVCRDVTQDYLRRPRPCVNAKPNWRACSKSAGSAAWRSICEPASAIAGRRNIC